jgi:hypothetical protein
MMKLDNLDFDAIVQLDKILEQANDHNLLLEVVASALQHQKDFPKASIQECLLVAANEWDL